ncbi:MAG: hypothetical protein KGQ37_08290 [Hyphomicrobiales bacterium]|nr:hypothetical protein [Hyphomicrobiales bacterium]
MADDLIRYDLKVQKAMRQVIRGVIGDAARDGLPGGHFFQISFRTDAPGVKLSPELLKRCPEQMTIILQYQFQDLVVSDYSLEVVLFFNHVPERLVIPFSAITEFYDPSVQFGLRFDVASADEPAAEPAPAASKVATPVSAAAQLAKNIEERGKRIQREPQADAITSDDSGKVVAVDFSRRKP